MNSGTTPPYPTNAPFNPSPYETGPDEEGGNPNFFRTTWLAILERKWWALAMFLLCVLGSVLYTFLSTPIYSSVVTVQVLKSGAQVLRGADVVENSITSDVDFNTQIKVLESLAIVQSVAARLKPEEVKSLTDPYKNAADVPNPVPIIFNNRKILPQRLTLIASVQFRHPDPKVAARIANLIASEYIAYNSRLRIDESVKAIDDLKDRADQQRKRVDEIANALQAYRQRGNQVSLIQSKDIVTEKLKALNLRTTDTASRFKEAEVRWNQVQEWNRAGRDLSELPFIAANAKVSQLLIQVTSQKLTVAQLRERYRDKHPRLIEAVNTLAETEVELRAALDLAAASVKADFETTSQNDAAARQALAEQEARSLELDRSAVEYENLNRDFRVNEQLLEAMMIRMREASVTSSIEVESARIVDRAYESSKPVSPKLAVNLAIGIAAGLFLGFGLAFALATIDDRIKTSFDVQSLIGLPLLGIVPRIDRMEQPDKAQIVSNGADRSIAESFLSIYSNLRVSDDSRNARLLLVTSTQPGEGKSFIASNLALTFASQNLRTVLVDCDLRKPNVERSFRLSPREGVANYCQQGAKLDDIVTANVHPNLDVITVGSRVKNPIQLLNSPAFEGLVAELGARYDRVVFDTPPLGAVSDALNILSLMDGAVFAIRHNFVKRGMAQGCIQRLRSANVPIFGAILNDTVGRSVDEYYSQNSKFFREYYSTPPENSAVQASS